MFSQDFISVLDACVLVPLFLRDTLLRLAETPHFYMPRWSTQILEEFKRTLAKPNFGLTSQQIEYQEHCLRAAFPDACVSGYEALVPAMQNHVKDRHVLAAAVKSSAQCVVTFNLRHFPQHALEPYGIVAHSPDQFLVHQFHLNPDLVVRKLSEQGQGVRRPLGAVLSSLAKCTPEFTATVESYLAESRSTLGPDVFYRSCNDRIQ